MKKILIIVIFLLAAGLQLPAQTTLDKLVLTKINKYRAGLKLSQLSWNDTIYKGARHHTDYEYLVNKAEIDKAISKKDVMDKCDSGHDEYVRVNGIQSESYETRVHKYRFREECVTMFSGHMLLNEQEISEWIVQSWKDSPSHDIILREPGIKYGAAATKAILIYKVTEKMKQHYLKYGSVELKDIIYFSSTFNCR